MCVQSKKKWITVCVVGKRYSFIVLCEQETEEAVAYVFAHVNVCVSPVWGINIRETAEVRTNPGLFPWARPALTGSFLHVISQWIQTVILAHCLALLQCVSFPQAVPHGRQEDTYTVFMGV